MGTQLTEGDHLEGLREAMLAFVRYADRAGLAAAVPTCPDWTVRSLVAHQGMVHRWATGHLRQEPVADTAAIERAGGSDADPLEWLADGAIDLAQALTRAAPDVPAPVFLADAPAPRAFWARRQCHETTMHAVDALAASLGRAPKAEEVWVGPDLAADGIDELLAGFHGRAKSRLRSERGGRLVVAPTDRPEWWEVTLSDAPAVTRRRTDDVARDADWVVEGPAVDLYLRLWNRGAEPVEACGDWQGLTAVTW